ncbi:MAG TPA: AMP-binding protein [Spirochaetota bacterium]|nr:AMP-binding protein [Spirochaetota bacterium]
MFDNLYDFYRKTCEQYSDRILFNGSMAYAEGFAIAEQRAAFLQSEGFKKGDVIALLAVSNHEWVLTYMAIGMMGGIVLPLDVNLPASQYPVMLKKMKAKAVFISDGYKNRAGGIKTYSVAQNRSVEKKKKIKVPSMTPDDIASYIFTSGTTGDPKIITLSHRNIFVTGSSTAQRAHMSSKDVMLCLLPLYHVYALDACFAGPFAHGSSFVWQTSLKGPDIMKSLAGNPITIFPAAPLLWEMFMDAIINKVKAESDFKYKLFTFFLEYGTFMRKIGLSPVVNRIFDPVHVLFGRSHRFFVSGGAPLKNKYRKYYRSMGFILVEGYGLSETTGPICLPDPNHNPIGSVGPATAGNQLKIVDFNQDGVGEICFKGDSVMPGYYKNDEANKKVFDDEGFFHTGDLGKLDKKGNLYITGRIKNVIVLSSGKNVYPEELESYYKQSSAIEEIAVFGLEKDGNEHVYAVIVPVLKSDKSFDLIRNEIIRLNKGLPSYKILNDFAISFDKLPVNSARKVVYSQVRELLAKGVYMEHENDTAVLREILTGLSPAENEIIDLLKKKLRTKTIYTRQTYADFDIDSLGLVDLAAHFEENLGVTIDVEKMKSIQTMDALLVYLSSLEKGSGSKITDRLFKGKITEKPLLFFNPFLYLWMGLIDLLCRFAWKVEVRNPGNLDIKNNIIMANHTSFLDLLFIIRAMKIRDIKNTYAIGKKEVDVIKYVFHGMPVIWIDYAKNTNEVFKRSSDLLRQNKSIMIFPEGKRTDTGEIQEFKLGAAYLAKNIDREIIPITINGAYDIWPSHKTFPEIFTKKRGTITIGKKIKPSEFKTIEALTAKVQKEIEKELDPGLNKL